MRPFLPFILALGLISSPFFAYGGGSADPFRRAPKFRELIVPIVIIGEKDERTPISKGYKSAGLTEDELKQSFSSLGLIVCPAKGGFPGIQGTGALVGDDSTIITASHVIINENGKYRVTHQDCYFSDYAQPNEHIPLSSRVGDYITGNSPETIGDSLGEYAIVHLVRPVQNAIPYAIDPTNTHVKKGDLLVAITNSFFKTRAGPGREPLIQTCSATMNYAPDARGRRAYLTNCSDVQGDSGAISLIRMPGGELVVKGVVVGSIPGSFNGCAYSDDNCAGFSNELTGPFLYALQNMIKSHAARSSQRSATCPPSATAGKPTKSAKGAAPEESSCAETVTKPEPTCGGSGTLPPCAASSPPKSGEWL